MASVPVPEWQRKIHISTEALALLVFVPWLFAAAKVSKEPHRSRLQFIAVGTLLLDGYLLYRWLSAPRPPPQETQGPVRVRKRFRRPRRRSARS